ncbi:hypothetical protein [Acinetobacter sp. BSP-53]|uniref:hypothetical protein n=1 Tax=Acinetobacter sp. BSP-53 TaxID=3344662 RepID=UPI00376F787D
MNRNLQQEILIQAAEAYPLAMSDESLEELRRNFGDEKLVRELKYLEESKLLHHESIIIGIDNNISFGIIKITNKGLDFIQSDGGISAILNVVTVRFESDTLTALIATRINESDLPEDDRNKLVEAVKELPSDGIKHLMTKVLDKGVENIPNLVRIISDTLNNIPS